MGEVENRCLECGAENEPGQEKCAICNAPLGKIRVMTTAEREKFGGVTIEQDNGSGDYSTFDRNTASRNRIYVRQISLGGAGLLTKLILGAGLIAVIMFIALPLIFLLMGVVFFGWLVFRRKH